jgi:hypothetical protein
MTTREAISHPDHVDPGRRAKERAALAAVLTSATFENKPRLANLLKYICEKHFDGDTDAIKEYSIATDVFGRSHSFDQATDSIVRVEVFRLRKKLREFYAGEGADHPVEIVVATGHYRPEFVDRIPPTPSRTPPRDSNPLAASSKPEQGIESRDPSWAAGRENADRQDLIPLGQNPPTIRRPLWSQRRFLATVAILAIVAGAATIWRISRHRYAARVDPAHASTTPISAVPIGPQIRIRCGYSRPIFKDEEGNVWSGDRYFSGGFVTDLPNQHIARTRNPELYLTARTGVFSYKIPLAPGIYELRLHFAETTYSPASSLGGGENSRVFDVQLNGNPLLQQFDIVSDAGANTADVRVFRDISPARTALFTSIFLVHWGCRSSTRLRSYPARRIVYARFAWWLKTASSWMQREISGCPTPITAVAGLPQIKSRLTVRRNRASMPVNATETSVMPFRLMQELTSSPYIFPRNIGGPVSPSSAE